MVVQQKISTYYYLKIYSMGEVLVRSLSGVIYVVLLIGSMFLGKEVYTVLFMLLGVVSLLEFQKLIALKNWSIPILFAGTVLLFYKLAIPSYLLWTLLGITIVVSLHLITDLIRVKQNTISVLRKYILCVFYIIVSFVCLIELPKYQGVFEPTIILGAFILIWVNDSFAFIVGKSIGKHKLLERISPKKTIEGFLGGLLFAMVASYLIYYFTNSLSPIIWLVMSLIISIFGTVGDLIQSKFKRRAGVKDSGTIMPGHGGMYDRLDSIIFAGPFLYTFLIIFKQYVS